MAKIDDKSIEKQRLISSGDEEADSTPRIHFQRLPVGVWFIEWVGVLSRVDPIRKKKFYQAMIVVLTFCCYTTYHMTRKTISVVKSTLHPDCNSSGTCADRGESCAGWPPFDDPNDGKTLLGTLDYAWLFSYAIAMFFSGQLADRTNLRYFLTVGMLGSIASVALFGMGNFVHIHQLYYFILVQVFGGIMQSSGWPGVVAIMANWFGKGRRGFIMGIWNCHTSIGNIIGTVVPAIWAHDIDEWGWSFMVTAMIMFAVMVLVFTFLVIDPSHVGLPTPRHHLDSVGDSEQSSTVINSCDLVKSASPATTKSQPGEKAVSFWQALLIPGVIEYSIALFFAKLVSYAFLFWLPFYVKNTRIGSHCLDTFQSGALSTMFDVGGMIGGILAGLVSDILKARAFTSVTALYLSIPSLYMFREMGGDSLALAIILMIITGAFVNAPYAMITTAVSADLGTHKSLQNSQKAKATVTAIIDGTGSIGAAVGPLITGLLSSDESWDSVFYFLMSSSLTSAVLLSRLVYADIKFWYKRCNEKQPVTSNTADDQ